MNMEFEDCVCGKQPVGAPDGVHCENPECAHRFQILSAIPLAAYVAWNKLMVALCDLENEDDL